MSNKPVFVYLGGPINGCNDCECTTWRDEAKVELDKTGLIPIDPMRRDYRGKELENVDGIVHGDMLDMQECKILLFNCWKPSFGTAMEIQYAATGIYPRPFIIAIHPPPRTKVSPWLLYYASIVVDDLKTALWTIKNHVSNVLR